MKQWTSTWGVPGLEDAVDISFSTRLSQSLGRCSPSTGRIVLSESLRGRPSAEIADALCHELAHVAAFLLYGGVVHAHGREWMELVRGVGFTPRVYRGVPRSGATRAVSVRRRSLRFEHRCPVCQAARVARRPVLRWRCAECWAVGLSGEMVVTLIDASEASR